jgi:diguanylate cyclase (GGDEF)-like protein
MKDGSTAPAQKHATRDPSAPPLRVLILDDEESIRRLLKTALTQFGCQVEVASNGRQGLQILLTKAFDVAVVDLHMQEMNGIAFIQEARKIWPWQGFVIYSGNIDQITAEIARREGLHHILSKPLDMKQLMEAILSESQRQESRAENSARQLPVNLISYQLNIMRHISRDVLQSRNVLAALINLSETLAEALPHHAMGILAIEEDQNALLLQSPKPQPASVLESLKGYVFERYQALSGKSIDANSIRVERVGPVATAPAVHELQSYTSVPIIIGDTVRGILALGSFEPNAFNEMNVTLLYHAAGTLATTLTALGEIKKIATRDALTGLYNRLQLDEEIKKCWQLSVRYKNPMATLILDLDQFKMVNDMWGHTVGDELIKEFAGFLKDTIRTSDFIARYGGDEFFIILPRADINEASVLAGRILDNTRSMRFLRNSIKLSITTSIGVAVQNPSDPFASAEQMIERADLALYRAKKSGRDRYYVSEEPVHGDQAHSASTLSGMNPDSNVRKSRGRVLILDDEEYILIILKRILEEKNFDVSVSRTVSEARELISRNSKSYDIFLCDLSLPDGNGLELIRWARDIDTEIVNIVISGNATTENAITALRSGAYDFVLKPIQAESIYALVDRAINYRNLLKENALYRAKLEDMVKSKSAELTTALDNIKVAYEFSLETMVAMLDAREFETGQHSIRVRDLTLVLSKAMNISDTIMDEIGRGALLHDIGKIGIPDSILMKPGSLTEEEWVIVRKHPEIGHRFMTNNTYLQTAAAIVLSHHERWDGKGYPHGLKGEAIPLGARIFSVIDAYDAMRSPRIYKKSVSVEKAVAEIKSKSGTQFDPKVVDVFLLCIPELEAIGRWS